MSEDSKDTGTTELLRRISELEATVASMARELAKVAKRQLDWDRLNMERIKLIDADLVDAFERIKNIELKFFPNLAGDIIRLTDVIGEGEGKAYNPLDHRKPSN